MDEQESQTSWRPYVCSGIPCTAVARVFQQQSITSLGCLRQSAAEERERMRLEAAAQRLPPGMEPVPAPCLPQGVCK